MLALITISMAVYRLIQHPMNSSHCPDGLLILRKPYGLSKSSDNSYRISGYGRTPPINVSVEEALPAMKERLQVDHLEVLHSPERLVELKYR